MDLNLEVLTNFYGDEVYITENADGTTTATYPDEDGNDTQKVYTIPFEQVVDRWYKLGWIY